ncbi:MAG: glucose-6-phosphate isomerase [Methylophilaceae bacterium]|jgi:glucose-6-phosphate isomerase|nr:glucose-6-phosphate isomerase [Methylophilaceae bacterium]
MTKIIDSNEWQDLKKHFDDIKNVQMRDLFKDDEQRFEKFHLALDDFLFDFSKNRINDKTLVLLNKLAIKADVEDWRAKQFSGDKINTTEDRAVLHTALRSQDDDPIFVDGIDVKPEVKKVLKQIESFSNSINDGSWKGFTGKKINTIVNIGIGGSDLGPAMVCKALQPFSHKDLRIHFVSNVDGADLALTLEKCDPETTLFIVASKTFTTQETMTNAFSARHWFLNHAKNNDAISQHFVAVSTNTEKVKEFGINEENMFIFWDWVGGRYSLWSSIGLSISIFLGYENFKALQTGAYEMDQHFLHAPIEKNMPIQMALIGIWYNNFFKFNTQAILPYDQGLSLLPSYLQQADMESNGKFIDRDGKRVCLETGPVIWGESGTNGQHAFYQLIHQGTQFVPCDFIMPIKSHYNPGDKKNLHHKILMSNLLAQSQSLMMGKTIDEARSELINSGLSDQEISSLLPHRSFEGNRPSNTILFEKLTPKNLGRLIALYEHKIFVQGVIWNINSFDQWGVEYGKQIARLVLPKIQGEKTTSCFDSSTNNLIDYIKKKC